MSRATRSTTRIRGPPTQACSGLTNLSMLAIRMPSTVNMWYVPRLVQMNVPRILITWQSTTEEAAKDIASFIAIFFENFSQFKGRAFHMAGESYAVSSDYIFSVFEGK